MDLLFVLRRHTKLIGGIFWLVAILGVLTVAFFFSKNKAGSTATIVGDANYYYAYLPSLIFDGDIDLTNDYVHTGNWYHLGTTDEGMPSNVFGIGTAIFSLPFFLAGLLLSKLVGISPTGFGAVEMKAALYASVVFSGVSVWPAAQILRRYFAWRWLAWSIPAVVLAGTSAVYYAVRQPGYSHPITMFWVTVLLNHCDPRSEAVDRLKSARWWMVAGALLGAAALSRPQASTWALVLLWPAWLDRRAGASAKQIAFRAGCALLTGLMCFFPQLWAWKVMYGSWLHLPQGPEFMRWDQPALTAVLFSSRNGLLSFTPLVTLALLGFLTVGRKRCSFALTLLIGFGLQVVVNGAVWDWWAGGSFGGRRFDSCFGVFCFGLAALVSAPWRLHERIRHHRLRLVTTAQRSFAAMSTLGLACYVLAIMAGNIALTSRISSASLESEGGQPYYQRLLERIPAPFAAPVAGLSYWTTKPIRWWFARKYDAPPFSYDWAVGKFFLGETYPGLNSRLPARSQHVALHVGQPFLIGHDPIVMPVTPREGGLRLLVPINRKHGPLEVRIELDRPPPPGVMAVWNSNPVSLNMEGSTVSFTAPRFNRGVNVIDLKLPKDVSVLSFSLSVPQNGRP